MTDSTRGGFNVSVVERVARTVGYAALGLALAIACLRLVRPNWGQSGAKALVVSVDATTSSNTDTLANTIARTLSERIVRHALQDNDQQSGRAWPLTFAAFTAVPSVGVRGVLGASVAAGLPVYWRDSTNVRSLVVSATSVPGPISQTLLAAVAGTSLNDSAVAQVITLRDRGGLLDSVAHTEARTGARLRLRARQLSGPVNAEVLRNGVVVAVAQSALPTADTVRAVRVFARIGWEAKFVTAALEESGWQVDGTVAVAPRALVRTGSAPPLDTSRYSAAVVLDSGVVSVRMLRAFVEQGGGVVVSGHALRDPALAAFASVRVRGERLAIAGALLTDHPRRGVAALQLAGQRGAVPLELDGTWPTMIVSRVGVGRVLGSGYYGTWHWRMEGTDDALNAHRAWWSNTVSTVAYSPAHSTTTSQVLGHLPRDRPGNVAPIADLFAQLGAPVPEFPRTAMRRSIYLPPVWLLVCIAGIALLSEWTMRRLRGAR